VVHVADVGTGLAVFVEGTDFSMVYDAGSNDDRALGDDNRFIAYLRAVKPELSTIDHVVLSHPHRDHVELLPDVLQRYRVKAVWDSGAVNAICGYRRFVEAVATGSAEYHTALHDAGTFEIDFGKPVCDLPATATVRHGSKVTENVPIALGAHATMTFLHVDGRGHGERYNENSLVTLLDLDGTRVLLMGDAEAGGRAEPDKPPSENSVEGYLLAKYRPQLDADLLVVGHHGSKSSSRQAFIQAVTPIISVISSGPTQYQSVVLPDAVIVTELEQVSQVWRTDRDDASCVAHGGCDNVRVEIRHGQMRPSYVRP